MSGGSGVSMFFFMGPLRLDVLVQFPDFRRQQWFGDEVVILASLVNSVT